MFGPSSCRCCCNIKHKYTFVAVLATIAQATMIPVHVSRTIACLNLAQVHDNGRTANDCERLDIYHRPVL